MTTRKLYSKAQNVTREINNVLKVILSSKFFVTIQLKKPVKVLDRVFA
jgi:hypothetical protein